MRKNIIIKIIASFILLISLGIILLYNADISAGEKSGVDKKIDMLLRDMGILKGPIGTGPVEFSLMDLKGGNVRISDFRGKIVFLNFWTTWCPSCRVEMSAMERLHTRLKDKDFAMVTVNLQEPPSRVEKYYRENRLTFPVLLDVNGVIGEKFAIRSIPTTFILDRTGHIMGQALGARKWDSKKSMALFEYLVNM